MVEPFAANSTSIQPGAGLGKVYETGTFKGPGGVQVQRLLALRPDSANVREALACLDPIAPSNTPAARSPKVLERSVRSGGIHFLPGKLQCG